MAKPKHVSTITASKIALAQSPAVPVTASQSHQRRLSVPWAISVFVEFRD